MELESDRFACPNTGGCAAHLAAGPLHYHGCPLVTRSFLKQSTVKWNSLNMFNLHLYFLLPCGIAVQAAPAPPSQQLHYHQHVHGITAQNPAHTSLSAAATFRLTILVYTTSRCLSCFVSRGRFALLRFHGPVNEYANFRTPGRAVLALLRCFTGEGWNELMHSLGMSARPAGRRSNLPREARVSFGVNR